MRIRLLRLVLVFSGFAWGASVFGIFLSWDTAILALQGMGAQPVVYDRMLDYWLRMASGAFTLVGLIFIVLAIVLCPYIALKDLAAISLSAWRWADR